MAAAKKVFQLNQRLEWQIEDREAAFHSPIFTLYRSERYYPKPELGREEMRGQFYYFESHNWVTVIPLVYNAESQDYDVILVEQFRHGSGQLVLEFPAGVIDEGESPQQGACREMREETGYGAENILRCEQLGVSCPNPAIMSNRTFTFGVLLKTDAVQEAQSLDEMEAIQSHRLPLSQLKQLIFSADSPFSSALMLQSMFWLENSDFLASLRQPQFPGKTGGTDDIIS